MPRSPASLVLAAIAPLALAACAQQQTAAPPVAAPAPVSSDQLFVDRADKGTANEVELGRVGRHQALSPTVRSFSGHLIGDYRQAHARLATLERRVSILPEEAPSTPGQLAAQFRGDFDRQFMADQVTNHQEAIRLFEDEARAGQDPRLRKYATDTLPVLYRNLREAQAIAARVGG